MFGLGIGLGVGIGRVNLASGPNSLISNWYNGLAVKPSASLLAALNTLSAGMNSDGDWTEIDFIAIMAGMETDEQRLNPIVTTSNENMTVFGIPTLDADGVINPVVGDENYLNTKWNPTDNGVKYTLNSAYLGVYGDTQTSVLPQAACFGSNNNIDSASMVDIESTSTAMRHASSNFLNSSASTFVAFNKTGLANSIKRFYVSTSRTSNTTISRFVNGNATTIALPTTSLSNLDFFILGDNESGTAYSNTAAKIRCVIAGSGLISSSRVAARLNTFWTAVGLPITNY